MERRQEGEEARGEREQGEWPQWRSRLRWKQGKKRTNRNRINPETEVYV